MNSLYGTAKGRRGFPSIFVSSASVLAFTTDGVIEDEDFGGTGPLRMSGGTHARWGTEKRKGFADARTLTLLSKPTPPPDNKLA